jgi:alpha-maltose-1-phosphate synthase
MSERAAKCLELEGAKPENIHICPPGVDLQRFQPRPKPESWLKSLNLDNDDFIFLSVAALVWEKGILDILHAFKKLTLHYPKQKIKLLFAGSGPLKKRIVELINQLDLNEKVRLTKFPYEKMHEAYNLADVFILASVPRPGWLEQFGYVLPEALASGNPIITTESGSIPEVVGDCAELVPPSDFLALYQKMELLLKSSKLDALRSKARLRAELNFNRDRNAQKWLHAYESLF